MLKINQRVFRDEISKNQSIIDYAFLLSQEQVEDLKQELLSEFDEHDVTREIQAGYEDPEGTPNITGTTFGRGNLYTFIGFNINDGDPTEPVREILESSIRLIKTSRSARYSGNSVIYQFPVSLPTLDGELANAAPMPFGTSISWLRAVERGVPGINSYIYWKYSERSNSTYGLMAKDSDGELKQIRNISSDSSPIQYISEILNKFKNRII